MRLNVKFGGDLLSPNPITSWERICGVHASGNATVIPLPAPEPRQHPHCDLYHIGIFAPRAFLKVVRSLLNDLHLAWSYPDLTKVFLTSIIEAV